LKHSPNLYGGREGFWIRVGKRLWIDAIRDMHDFWRFTPIPMARHNLSKIFFKMEKLLDVPQMKHNM
jgi:hypothetical protein